MEDHQIAHIQPDAKLYTTCPAIVEFLDNRGEVYQIIDFDHPVVAYQLPFWVLGPDESFSVRCVNDPPAFHSW